MSLLDQYCLNVKRMARSCVSTQPSGCLHDGAKEIVMVEKATMGQRWTGFTFSKAQMFWACAGAVVATAIVGFTWGGWVTGGTAQKMAAEAAAGARYELAANICVDRFKAGGDAGLQLAALKELKTWDRTQFVEKGGWAVMPGEPVTGRDRSASLCAEQLAELELAPGTAATVQ
jgi:hypothetical protein